MSEHGQEDAALFAQLRALWRDVDPMPATLIDRMIAAVAAEGLSEEYALLTLVDQPLGAVRSGTDALTLQFSDGTTSVLLHVSATDDGGRRLDGWVDAAALAIRLTQGDREWTAEPGEHGRFAFDRLTPGLVRLTLAVRADDGIREFQTPQFEL